jgi:hypothetical protein
MRAKSKAKKTIANETRDHEQSRPVLPHACEALASEFPYNFIMSKERYRELLAARIERGIGTNGQTLNTHNGRDAIEDAIQATGDALLYLTQAVLETSYKKEGARAFETWRAQGKAVELFTSLVTVAGLEKRGEKKEASGVES